MTDPQLRKAAMLWREHAWDTLEISEFLGVHECVVYNHMAEIIRKCPAKKVAAA